MTAAVRLRLARAADTAAVERCVVRAYAPYEASVGLRPAPLFADYPAAIRDARVTLACHGGSVAGLVVCDIVEGVFLLENVAVDPDFQGRGIGGALMAAAETIGRRAGHADITLYTHEKMTANQRLYRHLGYREIDRRREDGYDRIYLRKPLI